MGVSQNRPRQVKDGMELPDILLTYRTCTINCARSMRALKASLAIPWGGRTEKALVGCAGGRNSLSTLDSQDGCCPQIADLMAATIWLSHEFRIIADPGQ